MLVCLCRQRIVCLRGFGRAVRICGIVCACRVGGVCGVCRGVRTCRMVGIVRVYRIGGIVGVFCFCDGCLSVDDVLQGFLGRRAYSSWRYGDCARLTVYGRDDAALDLAYLVGKFFDAGRHGAPGDALDRERNVCRVELFNFLF